MIDVLAVPLLVESAPQSLSFLEFLSLAVDFLLVIESGVAMQFL
jgi:hypothetical protein